MAITKWNLADEIKTKDDAVRYLWASVMEVLDLPKEQVSEEDYDFVFIACKEILTIAKQKGWINE